MSIAVIGAGAWGTALAIAALRSTARVVLLGRDAGRMRQIAAGRENSKLPGVQLPAGIEATAEPAAIADIDLVILAVPCQALRETCGVMRRSITSDAAVVITAKGIERGSRAFVSDIVSEALPGSAPLVLSGPSFAADVARGLPTAVTLAGPDARLAEQAARRLGSAAFRIYHSDDRRGVEIGGAAKNVLAIAAGIVTGMGLGESARAAIIARGFAELRRFAAAHGARAETLMGLSGLGDLMLTAASAQSRNCAFGIALGQGRGVAEAAGGGLVEGAFTAPVLAAMAGQAGVDMPVTAGVAAIIAGTASVAEAVDALINRPQKAEY